MSYYSKQQRLVRKVYSVTASADFQSLYAPANIVGPHAQGVSGGGPDYNADFGSYVYNYPFDPRIIKIDIPDRGRILDVKVWVEFIHDYRLTSSTGNRGLHGVTLTLRSPNVKFFSGHPLQNNDAFRDKDISLLNGTKVPLYDIYRNSYILWDGPLVGGTLSWSANGARPASNEIGYMSYGSDCDMRTVFSDGSKNINPRNLDLLYPSASDTDPGESTGSQVGVPDWSDARALSASAPNHLLWEAEGYPCPLNITYQVVDPTAGANIPWIYDDRLLDMGGFNIAITGSTGFTASLGMSPPHGWLSGPGGDPGEGEYATTGSQIGRSNMQPVYPLLSDIVVERVFDDDLVSPTLETTYDTFIPRNGRFPGFRPGLRGTEINGTWEFLIGNQFEYAAGVPDPKSKSGIWFRQVRLEFLIDQGEDGSFIPQSRMRYKVPGYVPNRTGKNRMHILSGTAFWDAGINYVYEIVPEQYGRSIGMTDDPMTSPSLFSVFSQITGSLVENLATDDLTNMQQAFLKNEFGTPFIPISSGSGVTPSFTPFDLEQILISRNFTNEILNPALDVDQNATLRSLLSRAEFFKSTSDQVIDSLDALIAESSVTTGESSF